MTYHTKLNRAKSKLMLEHPYFGTLASALEVVPDNQEMTLRSDGVTLFINEEYIQRLSVEEMEFVLANGAMHALLKHQERGAERVGWLWQEASDLAINAMLVKNGLVCPEYLPYQPQFEGMYTEEIYAILHESMEENPQSEQESSPQGDLSKEQSRREPISASGQGEREGEVERISMQEQFEQLFQKSQRQGTLPKDLKWVVPTLFVSRVDWRTLLHRAIDAYAKSTYSFFPPNQKYLYCGIYLPTLSSDLLRLVIAIDTSGSIDQSLLAGFMAEVESIMQHFPHYEIELLTADSRIQSHEQFVTGEPLSYEVKGGGGTDFRPVFEWIEQRGAYPTLLLYFTDGMGSFPHAPPHYDVIWVVPEQIVPPFGEVLVLV